MGCQEQIFHRLRGTLSTPRRTRVPHLIHVETVPPMRLHPDLVPEHSLSVTHRVCSSL
jgi:hypothetical protein